MSFLTRQTRSARRSHTGAGYPYTVISVSKESVCADCGSPTENVLCNDCLRVFKSDLELISWLLEQLGITASKQAVMGSRAGGKSAETPDPVHWGAARARTALLKAVNDCARELIDDGIAGLSDTLMDNFRHFTTWLPAARHFKEIDAAVTNGMFVIDCSPPKSVFRAPCDVNGCEGEWWTIPGDDEYANCNVCGVVVGNEQVNRRLNNAIDGHLFSITEMALAMSIKLGKDVSRQRIHDLTRRKHDPLRPRGRTHDGHDLYSVADVELRMAQHGNRKK